MLYKNIPDKELHHVMYWRCFLDYLAAFSFILKGHFSNAKAVWQARKAYHQMRPDFFISRNMNMVYAVSEPALKPWCQSILKTYYMHVKRKFSDLCYGKVR